MLIDSEELIEVIDKVRNLISVNAYCAIKERLKMIPTAEVEGDLISREDVLDEIHRCLEERDYTLGSLYDNVCELPSAVIHCKDCKYHVGEGCCDYWDEGRMFLDISDSDYCSKAERRDGDEIHGKK